jgi:putative ABC transport system permease protein
LRPALLVLGFAGAVLVLVLMVNLASVLLARAAQREHEFAVSRALGANTGAIARATLFEGALLGTGGGIAAATLAVWGTRTLMALAPLDIPRREAVNVDWRIAAVVIGLGVLLGVVAAIAPAVWAARASLASLLASSAVRGGGGHGRLRRAMVVVQVSLSLVLLSAGGLVVRSLDHMLRADPGFVPDGLLTLRVPMPPQLIAKAEDVAVLQERIEQALSGLAGVVGVSATSGLPLTGAANQSTLTIPGAPGNTGNAEQDAPLTDTLGVRANYVTVMGMRVLEGRTFEPVRRAGVREALIDRHLARKFFPSGSAVGARIPLDNNQSVTVVGVVDQARLYDVHQDGRPQIMLRAEDWGYRTLNFVIRSSRDPAALTSDVRIAIRRLDPRLAIASVRTMDEVIGDALRRQRISAALLSGFALGALLLAAMGLVGVVSSSVTRRRHELAVRLAMGANHGGLVRLVLGEGALLVATGILIAVPAIYGAGRLLRGVLVGVSPLDPMTLASVGLALTLVTLTACYVPARRVLRIDPAQSLRQD